MAPIQTTVRSTKLAMIRQEWHGAASQINPRCSKVRTGLCPDAVAIAGVFAARGQRRLRLRGERLERPFAHLHETGGMRRAHLRGHANILKRLL